MHYAGENFDVTFPDQSPTLKASVLEAYQIQPVQIGEHKLYLHQKYLRNWLVQNEIYKRLSFEEIWRLREEWINFLASSS